MDKDKISNTLRNFKERRDDLLHEEADGFPIHLNRFIDFCEHDELVQSVISPVLQSTTVDIEGWWKQLSEHSAVFPSDPDSELALRYSILLAINNNDQLIFNFTFAFGKRKRDEGIEIFRSIVYRPFANELSARLSKAADLATPEERALQAIPLSRIPSAKETRIFLSHKSVDKPIVQRYYDALKELGFEPWLDKPDMPAGTNLERGILEGFENSCAAVFFITDNFKDESYLAAEVDHAVAQKRKKGKRFAIITLHYPTVSPVPGLLKPYIYINIQNDLEGFYELVRALPIELGQVRWKKDVVV